MIKLIGRDWSPTEGSSKISLYEPPNLTLIVLINYQFSVVNEYSDFVKRMLLLYLNHD